ncbi:hypothetical protein F8M41_015559 [Gigaspora margarita]|uniref:F-box domain-containing protein n=1 Tax=Gigaspora margarita TaxID=4874 RepID=A0A8H4AQK4_GIGMA|nr:hypothetical protein F8M41_015559 [Gigaspora margarita]
MITLPNECYYEIFNNLQHIRNFKNLFSCALVNRQWCRITIPILWSNPRHHFFDIRLIEILLLTLNAEEQAQLDPFKITFPSHPKPLFEYTSYITSVDHYLYNGVRNWIHYKRYEINIGREIEEAVKCSLIAMFLRTSKSLKDLNLDEIICNPIILENLYKNTTVSSVDFHPSVYIADDCKYKAIDGLVKILYKSSTLISLKLNSIKLGIIEIQILLRALDKNIKEEKR